MGSGIRAPQDFPANLSHPLPEQFNSGPNSRQIQSVTAGQPVRHAPRQKLVECDAGSLLLMEFRSFIRVDS
jgi:hypothetical protein